MSPVHLYVVYDKALLYKLKSVGIDGSFYFWPDLSDRHQRIAIDEEYSSFIYVKSGIL